jgi:ring-1,2-phenylacetyl-CoA epoxidase subunit PaaD
MRTSPLAQVERARACAASVPDPEIPVVTVDDLGILRDVRLDGARVVVTLTPTYTGCPATQVIADDVRDALAAGGFADADVRIELAPPWTTDWISDEGRRKLREYGIAPPGRAAAGGACGLAGGATESVLRFVPRTAADAADDAIDCPRCGSTAVERLSEYGSTPCKALYRCTACREPFDYFKPY